MVKLSLGENIQDKRIMPETATVRKYLETNGLSIVSCQVPVADEEVRLCTCLDLIVRNQEGQFLLVETKTGFNGYRDFHTGYSMSYPFQNFTDSPKNQHIVQTLVGEMLFRKSYPHITNISSQIWYVSPDKVTMITPPPFMLEGLLYAKLKASKHTTRKRRRKRKGRIIKRFY
jgi:hypothetical protein